MEGDDILTVFFYILINFHNRESENGESYDRRWKYF